MILAYKSESMALSLRNADFTAHATQPAGAMSVYCWHPACRHVLRTNVALGQGVSEPPLMEDTAGFYLVCPRCSRRTEFPGRD
jgi:hypothetical protein